MKNWQLESRRGYKDLERKCLLLNAEISEVKIVDTKWIFIGMAIAASITLIVVLVFVLSNTHSFEARSKSYESPDISKSNNSIMIKMPNMGSYFSASKLVTGKPVHFLLDLGEMSSSAVAIRLRLRVIKANPFCFFRNLMVKIKFNSNTHFHHLALSMLT